MILRLYRLLLLTYPPAFRRRFGTELTAAVAGELERARRRGAGAVFRLWRRLLVDHLFNALASWLLPPPANAHLPTAGLPDPDDKEPFPMLADLRLDFRLSLRSLAQSPGFSTVAVLILALGIGANSTIFTLVNSLFLADPPGIVEADRLIRLTRVQDGRTAGGLGYPDYAFYRDHSRTVSGLAAYDNAPQTLNFDRPEGPRAVTARLVSGNFFAALGVKPQAGRLIDTGDAAVTGSGVVAVASDGFWRRQLGGDPAAIGDTLTLNGQPVTLVGVAPPEYRAVTPLSAPADLWLPLTALPALTRTPADFFERVEGQRIVWLEVIGRLAPGRSVAEARAELDTLATRQAAEFPEWHGEEGVEVAANYRLGARDHRSLTSLMTMLGAMVLAVLVIASANLAILLLARASARRRMVGVQAALGASRLQVARQALIESSLLAVGGAAGGLLLAFLGSRAAAGLLPVRLTASAAPDSTVLLFTLALATLTALLFGAAPALAAARTDILSSLKGDSGGAGGSLARDLLVVAQVALSIVVVIGAGLLTRSLVEARSVDLGFEPDPILMANVRLGDHGFDDAAAGLFVRESRRRLAALPGVESASVTAMVPFRGIWTRTITLPGEQEAEDGSSYDVGINVVGPGYFETLRIPLLAGRGFADSDGPETPVVIVNRTLAEELWPGDAGIAGQTVGRTVGIGGGRLATVVGVAADATYYELGEEPRTQLYEPAPQPHIQALTLMIRARGVPAGLTEAVRAELGAIAPELATATIEPLSGQVDQETASFRVSATLVSLFGSLALLLAAVGVYGVLSYLVVRRTREIGVRIALGATRQQIASTVVGRGLRLALAGILLGTAAALPATALLEGFLFGVGERDPATFVSVPLLLAAVALLASLLPARRAAAVAPTTALRADQ